MCIIIIFLLILLLSLLLCEACRDMIFRKQLKIIGRNLT